MYPIPPSEHLVESRICRQCTTAFPITDKDMEFYEKVSPSFGKKKYIIPPPTLCPDCRQQRRLSFRNERKLYNRKCDATGKDIVSIYSPDKPYTVYHQDYWWSDVWDPMSYGREVDLGRSMMEQMRELIREVPKPSLLNTGMTNAEYVNYSSYLKDSYLVFDTTQGENLIYGNNTEYTNSTVDFQDARQCNECYEIIDCSECYNIRYGWGCSFSHDCQYVVDLDNAHHCFLSDTVYNRSYIFENIEYSPEDYAKKVQEFFILPRKEKEQKIQAWKKRYTIDKVYPYHLSVTFENSTGSGLLNVKNAFSCYSIQESKDTKYCTNAAKLQNCQDIGSVGDGAELSYEVNAAMRMYRVCFGFGTWGSDMYYTDHCSFCDHIFLCVGLKNKSYCILNHQYTKEEYEKLVPRIIERMMKDGEWGEFFSASMSPFGYNETVASEYFPLTKLEAIKDGVFNWSDYEAPFPRVEKVIPASKLPDDIASIPDDILNWAIECEVTKKPFRIIKQELEFYRKHGIAIPRRHPDQRHLDRMNMRNPRKLYERVCDCIECDENWKKRGIILKEGENAEYKKNTETLDSSFLGMTGTIETEQNPQSSASFQIAPLQRSLRKKMITTYAPERPETVYCEVCYEREVMG